MSISSRPPFSRNQTCTHPAVSYTEALSRGQSGLQEAEGSYGIILVRHEYVGTYVVIISIRAIGSGLN